eukprot:5799643-Pyramimonas_sp.AAC.1
MRDAEEAERARSPSAQGFKTASKKRALRDSDATTTSLIARAFAQLSREISSTTSRAVVLRSSARRSARARNPRGFRGALASYLGIAIKLADG